MNDVTRYLTNGDLSDLSELSEDEDNIDVMIYYQTTSKQYDSDGSEVEGNMPLAAHVASKINEAASSEDGVEKPVALLQSTNDPTSSKSSKKTNKKRIFRWRIFRRDLPQASREFFGRQLRL